MREKIGFIPVITILRGLAALMVCLFHFVCKTTGYFNDKWVLAIFSYGGLGVSVFFVISGIVLPLAMLNGNYTVSSWKKFLAKRLIRIEPPYIVSVIFAVIYMYLRSYLPSSVGVDLVPNVKDIFLHLGYLVPFFENARWLNGAFWTLAIEFQYYLLLILLFPLMVNKKIYFRILFYLILLLPSFLIDSKGFFPHWASLFLIGIVYILRKSKIINNIEYVVVTLITAIIINYIIGIDNLITAALTLLVIHFFSNFSQKQFNFLGKISYSLYLVHGLTGSAIINVLSHYLNESYQKPLVVFIGLFFSIFCAYLLYLFVEKPSQKLAASIGYSSKK